MVAVERVHAASPKRTYDCRTPMADSGQNRTNQFRMLPSPPRNWIATIPAAPFAAVSDRKSGQFSLRSTDHRSTGDEAHFSPAGEANALSARGGLQSNSVGGYRLEALRRVPAFGASCRGTWALHDQGQSAAWRETDAASAPRGSHLYRHFRRLLHRSWRRIRRR